MFSMFSEPRELVKEDEKKRPRLSSGSGETAGQSTKKFKGESRRKATAFRKPLAYATPAKTRRSPDEALDKLKDSLGVVDTSFWEINSSSDNGLDDSGEWERDMAEFMVEGLELQAKKISRRAQNRMIDQLLYDNDGN